jgi:hypothetical protein
MAICLAGGDGLTQTGIVPAEDRDMRPGGLHRSSRREPDAAAPARDQCMLSNKGSHSDRDSGERRAIDMF